MFVRHLAVRCATAGVLAAVVFALPAFSQPNRYRFTTIAKLGQQSPGGGVLSFGFENMSVNNRGDIAFGAYFPDWTEGMFCATRGRLFEIAKSGDAAPGTSGKNFDPFGLCGGPTAISPVQVLFSFSIEPFGGINLNCGLYSYSLIDHKLQPVIVPSVTPAPTGGTFRGTGGFALGINGPGDAVFGAGIATTNGHVPSSGLGEGVFQASRSGVVRKVVAPGDPGPFDKLFDYAQNATINSQGDVAFGGHLKGTECKTLDNPPELFCAESVFLKDGQHGQILSIAQQDTAIPASAGGGTYDFAFGPVINERGDILFTGGLKGVPGVAGFSSFALFVWQRGNLVKVARVGDPMPGGDKFKSASLFSGDVDMNERGDVAFAAILDNDANEVYLWSRRQMSLVAKTGTSLPGIGVIEHLNLLGRGFPIGPGVRMNDHGEIVFSAKLTNGDGVLVLASPY